MGHARNSNEIVIGTREGVVRAFAIRRQAPEDRWEGDLILNMKGTPEQPDPNRQGDRIPIRITFDEASRREVVPTTQEAETEIRRFRITIPMLENTVLRTIVKGVVPRGPGCRNPEHAQKYADRGL